MSRKITIIGAGQVGSTIAYALTLKQLASEIVIIDIVKDKAMMALSDDELKLIYKNFGVVSQNNRV